MSHLIVYVARFSFFALLLFGLAVSGHAQNSDPNIDTGIHPYETYDGARESINLGSGNVLVSVPLLTLPGRNGHNYSVALLSNSQSWSASSINSWANANVGMFLSRTANFYFHPSGVTNPVTGVQCLSGYILSDESGGAHSFSTLRSNCIWVGGGVNQGMREPQYDVLAGNDDRGESFHADLNACSLTMKNGNWLPLLSGSGGCPLNGVIGGSSSHPPVLTDSNGNQILSDAFPSSSGSVLGGGDTFPVGSDTDTVGRSVTFSSPSIQYKDSNGVQRTITLNVQRSALSCNFAVPGSGRAQPSGTPSVVTSAVLPNGLTYIFQYDGCGSLTKIVYPSGGYTRYVFDYSHYTHSLPNGIGTVTDIELTQKFVCRAPSVTPGATSTATGNTCPVAEDLTTYSPTVGSGICNHSANSVTDPLGNLTALQFTNYTNCAYTVAESSRSVYQGSSTLLRTVQTTYTGNAVVAIFPATQTTILPNGLQSQIQWDYWSLDYVKEKREYAWGQGAPGALTRKTDYGQSYCYDRKPNETNYDGSGTQVASTTYEFDNYTAGLGVSGVGGPTNPASPARCNITAIQRWRNTDGATLTTRMQYDDAGNVLSVTDPLSHTTTTSYADVWGNTTCAPTKSAAYPTQVTDAAGHVTKRSYNSCTGSLASSTDANNQVTSLSYDLMGRPIQTNLPDTGQLSTCFSEISGSTCYNASFPLQVVSTQKTTSSVNKISTTLVDGDLPPGFAHGIIRHQVLLNS